MIMKRKVLTSVKVILHDYEMQWLINNTCDEYPVKNKSLFE